MQQLAFTKSQIKEALQRKIYNENELNSTSSQEETKLLLEVALLCIGSRSSPTIKTTRLDLHYRFVKLCEI